MLPARSNRPKSARSEPGKDLPSAAVRRPGDDLAKIAQASVKLAALGPLLAQVAGDVQSQAQAQQQRAKAASLTMKGLAQDLDKAVADLRASSVQMGPALKTVERIAKETQILSINASIEASRVGAGAAAFSIVAEEVKRLAEDTGQTTRMIGERMSEIAGSIERVASVTDVAEGTTTPSRSVSAVNREVADMADSADLQLGSAGKAHSVGDQILKLTESLLLSVGRFRFEAHARAEEAVGSVLPALVQSLGNAPLLHQELIRWMEAYPHFELAYLTDPSGRQQTDNLVSHEGKVSRDPAGFGKDWSQRPWYLAALRNEGVVSTDVYRSQATGDYCFTIAAALRDRRGALAGVLGSDVNFQLLVGT